MKEDEMGGTCSSHGEKREMITIFWRGNVKEVRVLGRPRCKWKDNNQMNMKVIGRGAVG
jgi:hypothetical protein